MRLPASIREDRTRNEVGQRRLVCSLLVSAVAVAASAPASAGIIVALDQVVGPAGPYAGIVSTVNDVNNDNAVGASPNTLVAQGTLEILGLSPIDFVIDVQNSGGTTEYFADFGTALNSTGSTWKGFEFQLGLGVGSTFVPVSALPSNPFLGGLDSDFPEKDLTPVTSIFNLASWEPDRILFLGGGELLPGASGVGSNFALDVPDIAGASSYQFTIRAQPVVPEPSSAVLFCIGAAVAGVAKRRQGRARNS